jgi:peptidoglycan-associated lipoprotein
VNPGVEKRHFERVDAVEGARTRLLYVAPLERTSLEVMRNYKDALLAGGFKVLFECNRQTCGDSPERPFLEFNASRRLNATQEMEYAFAAGVVDPRMLVVKLDRPQGTAHVIVFVAFQDNVANKAASNRVAVFVDIVESGTMEKRMVTVQAPEMATNIGRDGKQAIYGIYFDFDKADIKPEYRDIVQAHAAYLAQNSGTKVTLEGNTDERGTREYNMGLGERRANAVKSVLTLQGASAGQVDTVSYGEERPVAMGHDEQSWGQNRRVEIVYH